MDLWPDSFVGNASTSFQKKGDTEAEGVGCAMKIMLKAALFVIVWLLAGAAFAGADKACGGRPLTSSEKEVASFLAMLREGEKAPVTREWLLRKCINLDLVEKKLGHPAVFLVADEKVRAAFEVRGVKLKETRSNAGETSLIHQIKTSGVGLEFERGLAQRVSGQNKMGMRWLKAKEKSGLTVAHHALLSGDQGWRDMLQRKELMWWEVSASEGLGLESFLLTEPCVGSARSDDFVLDVLGTASRETLRQERPFFAVPWVTLSVLEWVGLRRPTLYEKMVELGLMTDGERKDVAAGLKVLASTRREEFDFLRTFEYKKKTKFCETYITRQQKGDHP